MTSASRGIPIHTRSLSITLREGDAGEVAFAAYVLDLRKRGVVPVGGDLQSTGIIHHMMLEGTVDAAVPAYRTIAGRMPTVAFEPSAGTGGESCRDRVDNVAGLAGLPLGDGYARGVGGQIGGVLGCSHVLTLAQLLGPTIVWALEHEAARTSDVSRAPGERFFRRDVTVDGFVDGETLHLLAQLNDLHLREAARSVATTDLLDAQTEIRVQGGLSLEDMRIGQVVIEERRRTLDTYDSARWRHRDDRVAVLEGASLTSGISATLLARFEEPGTDRPLLDSMLMLAPATIQCLASYRDSWTQLGTSRLSETGGHADSCYMWRTGGALQRRRERGEDP